MLVGGEEDWLSVRAAPARSNGSVGLCLVVQRDQQILQARQAVTLQRGDAIRRQPFLQHAHLLAAQRQGGFVRQYHPQGEVVRQRGAGHQCTVERELAHRQAGGRASAVQQRQRRGQGGAPRTFDQALLEDLRRVQLQLQGLHL